MNAEAIIAYCETLRSQKIASPSDLPQGIQITDFSRAKVVSKPWGFELWFAYDETLPYALKILCVKKGMKMSLQYHKEKTEHHVLFAGQIKLHYQSSKTEKIVSQIFSEGAVIQVLPLAKHRIEAVSDALLFEVSSNHLEDIVRLQDDYQRV